MTHGYAVVHASQPTAWAHVPAIPPGAVLAGTGLVAAATVAGGWLARRPGQRQIWFAAAAGALLGEQPRRRVAGWLALMCLSPVIGAAAADALPIPVAAEPVLLAVAAGILAQAARVSLRAAFRGLRPTRLLLSGSAAVSTMAAIATVLAVYGAGTE
jgi:hypothetical protein